MEQVHVQVVNRTEGEFVKATCRVKDSNNKTVGFIIDDYYVKYYTALQNIGLISNLKEVSGGILKSKHGKLKEVYVKDINKEHLHMLCLDNPLEREIQTQFEDWRHNWNKYVLYVTGARQIGKTTELLKFAYRHYEQVIYVNLANERDLGNFKNYVLSNTAMFGMINYCRHSGLEEYTDSSKTILIIDEIQESYEIYNSIRALQSGLLCDIAVTGSYLGKTLNSKYFKPVGNTKEIEMMSLSFHEFCRANNSEKLLDNIDIYGKSASKEYEALTSLYRVYTKIGGYPAVVREYIKSKDMHMCNSIIENIVQRFTEESASYFNNDKCMVVFNNVYKAAFMMMSKEKKGTASKDVQDVTDFVIRDTKEHVSRKEINQVLAWLKYSKIIGSCDLYNQGNVNDMLSERRFYFMDCGIANYIAGLTPISNDAVQGIIVENFVYNELYRLYKKHLLKGDKPCCSVYGNYELDFMLVDKQDKTYGIEVKSTKSNKHASLDIYKSKGFIDEAYVVEITRGGKGQTCNTIPIYTVGCRFPYRKGKYEA